MITFWRRLFAKPVNIIPPPPAEIVYRPHIGKLVKASGDRVKASAEILNEEIEDLLRENVELRTRIKK